MDTGGMKVNMTPCHPGEFMRTEVLEALDLNVTRAAEILKVRRATLSAVLNGKAALSPEMGFAHRKGVRREYGDAAEDAGLVRRLADTCPCW